MNILLKWRGVLACHVDMEEVAVNQAGVANKRLSPIFLYTFFLASGANMILVANSRAISSLLPKEIGSNEHYVKTW